MWRGEPISTKPVLGGHETFPFRYGWLKKGIDTLCHDPFLFSQEDALVRLGVGKNMVRSIRFWCLATRLIQEQTLAASNRKAYIPTSLGKRLLSDDGWDPYLEDTASLWLLHWLLATNQKHAFTWFTVFNTFNGAEFTRAHQARFLQHFCQRKGWQVSFASIERDVDCFVRTYTPSRQTKHHLTEDAINCPLVELNLIHTLPDRETYFITREARPGLPTPVFGYALLEFLSEYTGTRRTIALEDALNQQGSPGQVFKLDEVHFLNALEDLQEITNGALAIDETAGLRQLYLNHTIEPVDMLHFYYEGRKIR